MRVILDIRKDLRYQQGREEGADENNKQVALKMLESGISISMVQQITGLSLEQLKKLEGKVKA